MRSRRKVSQCQKLLQYHKCTITKNIKMSSYNVILDDNIRNLTFETVMANFLFLFYFYNEDRVKYDQSQKIWYTVYHKKFIGINFCE